MTPDSIPLPTPQPGWHLSRFDHVTHYAIGVVIYNLLVILWGAYVRATGSGVGCGSHWPLCDGVVIPRAPEAEALIELTQRGTSGIAALAVFALTWWVFRARPVGHPARRSAALSSVFASIGVLLGGGLALFGGAGSDAAWSQVVALGLHLANTFFLLATLSLTTWRLGGGSGNAWIAAGVDGALVVSTLGMTLFVGVTGAITSPGDTLLPAASLAGGLVPDVSPMSHVLVRLRVVHPVIAVLTAVAIIRAAWLLARRRPAPLTSRLARIATGLVVAQLAVGAISLVLRAPVVLQLGHLLMADLLWIALVLLGAQALRTAAPDRGMPAA